MKRMLLVLAAVGIFAAGIAGGIIGASLVLDNDPDSDQPSPAHAESPVPEVTITITPSPAVDVAAKRICRAIERNYLDDLGYFSRALDAGVMTGEEADAELRRIKEEYRDAKFENNCYALGF